MPEMSWLSPKRRRTTGNLKTLPNGQLKHAENSPPASPKPSIPRSRPVSQPFASDSSGASNDGNLFYAYARRGDDPRSRYLLTFASAAIANEWWLLTQAHFPDCTRPGPQLFSFRTEDLLARAWKHKAFQHLKTKWMYISFSDTDPSGVGGAAQGIIPVQDEQGNLLGGGSPAHPGLLGEVRKETKSVRNELGKLEEYFEKMMEAVERNTDGVKQLAESKGGESAGGGGGYFDSTQLTTHFGRLTDLLQRNTDYTENISKKHFENEQKLRAALEDVASKQRADYLDMSQLSSHLDRIQGMMEASMAERKDSAKSLKRPQNSTIDFEPLTSKLGKMQEAVEQNSALIRKLLDEGQAKNRQPKNPPAPKLDLSPLTEHLEKIHNAIEQQSSHMQALVEFTHGSAAARDGNEQHAVTVLAPLEQRLERIFSAIEEGNKQAKTAAKNAKSTDLSPLTKHLEMISQGTTDHAASIQRLVDASHETQMSLEKSRAVEVDLSPLASQLETIHTSSKQLLNAQQATRSAIEKSKAPAADFSPLAKQLEGLQASHKDQATFFQKLLDAQEATRMAVEQSGSEVDFSPLIERLEANQSSSDEHAKLMRQLIDAQRAAGKATPASINIQPLTKHIESIQTATDKNAQHIKSLIDLHSSGSETSIDLVPYLENIQSALEANSEIDFTPLAEHFDAMRVATEENTQNLQAVLTVRSTAPDWDLTPLTDRLNRIHTTLEKSAARRAPAETGSVGDAKFLMSALTSHLSKIQAVTEHNAQAVSRQAAAQHETGQQLRAIAEQGSAEKHRLEATESQVRELMAGQREMVKVMRDLAEAITAQNKGSCDHVVIPPPRKVGRKIVGFVYDAKEGPG